MQVTRWVFAILCLLTSSPAAAQISGRVFPPQPIAERGAAGESLNFDIVLRNDLDAPAKLAELEVIYQAADGTPLLARRVDGNGSAPSIRVLGDLVIPAGADRLFFNPFPILPLDVKAAKVTVRASFEPVSGGRAAPDTWLSAQVARTKSRSLLFPLRGRVLVWDGHDALSHHRRWDYTHPLLKELGFQSNAMRYAYDFVPVDAKGQIRSSATGGNESYVGFGAAVRSTGAGTVVNLVSDQPDDGSFTPEHSKKDSNALLGNYIVIEHGDGTFSMFGHLKRDSARVRVGEVVRAGQIIASIGSSGSALFPHLHYQLVNAPNMKGEGLPSYFRDVALVRGRRRVPPEQGRVDSGDVLVSK